MGKEDVLSQTHEDSMTRLVTYGNMIQPSVRKDFTPAGWTQFYSLCTCTQCLEKQMALSGSCRRTCTTYVRNVSQVLPLLFYFKVFLILFWKMSPKLKLIIYIHLSSLCLHGHLHYKQKYSSQCTSTLWNTQMPDRNIKQMYDENTLPM